MARTFDLSIADLLSRSRRQPVAYARQVAMYLSRELAGKRVCIDGGAAYPTSTRPYLHDSSTLEAIGRSGFPADRQSIDRTRASAASGETAARVSFPRIAMAFARDHSSVIHACHKIQRRCRRNLSVARLLETIKTELCAASKLGGDGARDAPVASGLGRESLDVQVPITVSAACYIQPALERS